MDKSVLHWSEPNMPTLRLQFESGDARLGYNFTPNLKVDGIIIHLH